MNINATLLVQAGNFFIAYFLFKFILLKPACLVLEQENTYRESLQEQVAAGQEQLDQKKAVHRKNWLQVHDFYIKNHPDSVDTYEIFQGISSSFIIKPISDDEVNKLVKQVGQRIALQIGTQK